MMNLLAAIARAAFVVLFFISLAAIPAPRINRLAGGDKMTFSEVLRQLPADGMFWLLAKIRPAVFRLTLGALAVASILTVLEQI